MTAIHDDACCCYVPALRPDIRARVVALRAGEPLPPLVARACGHPLGDGPCRPCLSAASGRARRVGRTWRRTVAP